MQKADSQPDSGASPNHVALDEAVIRINGQQYWLYAAIDPEPNTFLHIRLLSTHTTGLTEIFLRNYGRNTMSKPPCLSSTMRSGSKPLSADTASIADTNAMAIGMPSNVYLAT
jgi:transposase-like protein